MSKPERRQDDGSRPSPNKARKPTPVRRRRQSISTRDLLVQVTEQAISELGIARVTTRKIANAADVSEAAIFKYFATKEELVLAALHNRAMPRPALKKGLAVSHGSTEQCLARAAGIAVYYYDRVMFPLIAAMADTALLRRYCKSLPGDTFLEELRSMITGHIECKQSSGHVLSTVKPVVISDILLSMALQHVVERICGGVMTSRSSDPRFAHKLGQDLASMIVLDTTTCRK